MLRLTPLDIHFLRNVDHVVANLDREEHCLRMENRVLTTSLNACERALGRREAEVWRLDRMCRLLWLCIIALVLACGWLGWLAGEAGR